MGGAKHLLSVGMCLCTFPQTLLQSHAVPAAPLQSNRNSTSTDVPPGPWPTLLVSSRTSATEALFTCTRFTCTHFTDAPPMLHRCVTNAPPMHAASETHVYTVRVQARFPVFNTRQVVLNVLFDGAPCCFAACGCIHGLGHVAMATATHQRTAAAAAARLRLRTQRRIRAHLNSKQPDLDGRSDLMAIALIALMRARSIGCAQALHAHGPAGL